MDDNQRKAVEDEEEEKRFREMQTQSDFHRSQQEELLKRATYDPLQMTKLNRREQRVGGTAQDFFKPSSSAASSQKQL